jgi:hypothetical protein
LKRQALEIAKLQKSIDSMHARLSEYEVSTNQKDMVISNLTVALEKQREKTELQRVMMEWKVKKLEANKDVCFELRLVPRLLPIYFERFEISKGFTMKIAEKYYQQRIKAKLFLNWHIVLTNRHKIKVEKACKKKAEEICLDLANQYEVKIKKLNEELKCSHDDIDKYKYEMAKYEENMKRALMRGVCALNLEAMSIFTSKDDISLSSNRKSFNTHNFDRDGISNTYHSDDDITKSSNYSNSTVSDSDGLKQRVKFNETVKVFHNERLNNSLDDSITATTEGADPKTRTTGFKYMPPLPTKVFTNLNDHSSNNPKQQQVCS